MASGQERSSRDSMRDATIAPIQRIVPRRSMWAVGRALFLLLTLLSLARTSPADDAISQIPRLPEFVDSVNAAIDRGVGWLRARTEVESGHAEYLGYEAGVPAFATYAMRACGVRRDDPAMRAALDRLRQRYEAQKVSGELRTYTVALMCMAASEQDDRDPSKSKTSDTATPGFAPRDLAWIKDMAAWLQSAQHEGGWGYSQSEHGYDFSNTQYALLGLRAAARAGATVSRSTWESALTLYIKQQEESGPEVPRFVPSRAGTTAARVIDRARGWDYGRGGAPYGSMTAGGVASVVICRTELGSNCDRAQANQAERAVRDGIAWLGRHFSTMHNPGPGVGSGWATVYYYLYGVERAGVLANVDWMGESDWYGEGARSLLLAQNPAGWWGRITPTSTLRGNAAADSVLSTCCALLFLKRATLPVIRPAVTPSAKDSSRTR